MRFTAKIKQKVLSLGTQRANLLTSYPNSLCQIQRGQLIWIGTLQPTDFSLKYNIRIKYKIDTRPLIEVIDAPWKQGGKRPPHTYSDASLCLYYPPSKDFDRTIRLSQTIVPWTSEWLFHYELWLASGQRVWYGGGIEH
jgi:hypothetical protein